MTRNAQELREVLALLDPTRKRQLIARLRYEQELRRVAWACDIPKCPGQPHPGVPVRHSRFAQRMPFKQNDGMLGALWMAGRGFGKTRTGAEGVRQAVSRKTNSYGRIGLIGRTAADVRDVMIEGESGLLSVFPKWDRPEYQPSKRRVIFSNGAIATAYSADKPDQLRGPQHDFIWADEVSTFPKMLDVRIETGKPGPEGVLTNAFLGLRLGNQPRALLTGTPKRTRDMRYLVTMPMLYIITGTTYENLGNLADAFKDVIITQYEGTRVGKQELLGELLADVEGALLTSEYFEWQGFRPNHGDALPSNPSTTVVAVDPATTTTDTSDYTGICVASTDALKRYGYIHHSQRLKASPAASMERAAALYDQYDANYVVAEANNGGDYVKQVMHQLRPDIKVRTVHASKGKVARAEPVAALYEQRRIMHLGHPANHAALEDEWTGWVPDESDESPDVLDACVWALAKLMLGLKSPPPPARSG